MTKPVAPKGNGSGTAGATDPTVAGPKVLGPEVSYIDILKHYTEEKIKEEAKGPRVYNPLRPSSAGKDARELAYEYMEYKGYAKYEGEPMDAETHRLLKLGHSIEKHLLWELSDALALAGGDLEIRYKQQVVSIQTLPDGSKLEGSIDLTIIPRSKRFGGCLADVKSKKDKFSQGFKTAWDEMDAKLSNMKTVHKFGESSYWVEDLPAFLEELNDYYFAMNYKQLNLYYFDEHEFLKSRGVDHCAVVQYNKNDSRLREIRFKPSQQVADEVKDKFSFVQKTIDETKDPTQVPREHALGHIAWAFSKYRKVDWPEDDAMKAYFKTLPAKQWPKDLDRLPKKDQEELAQLFDQYQELSEASEKLEKIESDICLRLDRLKVFKIRLDDSNIYQMKRLKSGGPGGGERLVLRRGKL